MFKRKKKPFLSEQGEAVFLNALESTLRRGDISSLFGVSHDKSRDLSDIYGYKRSGERNYDYFSEMYRYNGFANVCISKVPQACWRDGVEIHVDGQPVLKDEIKQLKSAGIFSGFERSDILNRIGKFAVLFVGVPDGRKASEPVGKVLGKKRFSEVYFAPYSMQSVTISKYDDDVTSTRYGMPEIYTLTPRSDDNAGTSATDTRQTIQAHWTRVVHIAEGSLSNDIYGTYYLDPIADRLEDLNKTIGGSAEAFFRNASQKKTLDIDKDASIGKTELEGFSDSAKEWLNGWKDFIGLKGAKINALEVPNADPTKAVDVAIQEVSAYTGIPQRLLIGAGAGQLAGNEDKGSFNQVVSDRQSAKCEMWLMQGLQVLERAQMLVLPEAFEFFWPLPDAMDEKTASETNKNNAESFAKIISAISNGNLGGVPQETMQSIAEVLGIEAEIKEPEGDEPPEGDG